METPSFPAFRSQFGGLKRRVRRVRSATLCQLEEQLGRWIPDKLLAPAKEGANSRDRIFSLRRTFWCFLWQVLTPDTSCREVVRQVQALFGLRARGRVDEDTGAYCQARGRLPRERLEQALGASAKSADRLSPLAGRPVKVVDATSVQLPDTAANQKKYPQPSGQKPGCGFPVMQIVALFSLASGAIPKVVTDALDPHELSLFQRLWSALKPGDILLADRAYSAYLLLGQLAQRGMDGIMRLHQRRRVDWRKGKRLGRNDRLFQWRKGAVRPKYLSAEEWAQVAETMTVRVVRFVLPRKGYRTRRVSLVTTLLDPQAYPLEALAELYRRRWRLELCFRDLKTTMGMEHLRCQSPAMARKELLAYLIAHNLIRCLMAQAAARHTVDLERVSFKGSVDAARQYSGAMAQARNPETRKRLHDELLQNLARDLVPDRPGRREPRAVKRRPKPYPLLNEPRHEFQETPHRNTYRKPETTPVPLA